MRTLDFFIYCQNEYTTKLKIREEQIEGRRLRLEEKKAALERMENPPLLVLAKHERRGKQQQKVQPKRLEQEIEPLPYLPTPEEIIIQREGTIALVKYCYTATELILKSILALYCVWY